MVVVEVDGNEEDKEERREPKEPDEPKDDEEEKAEDREEEKEPRDEKAEPHMRAPLRAARAGEGAKSTTVATANAEVNQRIGDVRPGLRCGCG